jgi:hypothetical protein
MLDLRRFEVRDWNFGFHLRGFSVRYGQFQLSSIEVASRGKIVGQENLQSIVVAAKN